VFKKSDFLGKARSVRHNGVSLRVLFVLVAELVAPLVYGSLKLKSEADLLLLHDNVRTNREQEQLSVFGSRHPLVKATMPIFDSPLTMDGASEFSLEPLQDSGMAVGDTHLNDPVFGDVLAYAYAPIGVEKSGSVSGIHFYLQAANEKAANSGNTQNGQSRAKQDESPGMCREQVPPAKAKICSDPRRNTGRLAEMTSPGGDISHNAKYIHSATKCNTKYVHFVVDPLMFFRWTETRSWPNQVVDIRLLLLRLALVYKSRMFLTVLDGWSA